MTVDLVVKNGRITTELGTISADIAINEGKVVSLSSSATVPEADRVIDATGKYVLPGVIDSHVHLGYMQPFESDARTESKAAAIGGITTIGWMIIPTRDRPSMLKSFEEYKRAWERGAVVDTFFTLYVRDELNVDEIPKCPDIGITSFGEIGGYKGPKADLLGIKYMDDGFMYDICGKVQKMGYPGIVMLHAENIDVILRLLPNYQDRRDAEVWSDHRPKFCEAEAMERYIKVANAAQCPIYIVHMTIGEGVDIIAKAKAEGANVVAETCPQYLTHTKGAFQDRPTIACVNPPLRDKEDVAKLWQGIRDGWVECIGSDHTEMTSKQKGENIWDAPMGLGNTMSTMLPVLLSEGVNKGRISLETVARVTSYNPAKYMGLLPEKGTISVGSDADLVVVDLKRVVRPKADKLYSTSDINIYEGWELKGWPVYTIARGKIVMHDDSIVEKEGIGRYTPRKLTGNASFEDFRLRSALS